VTGIDKPLRENSELLLLADVMVTFAPTALSLPVCDAVVPTVTFPNETLAGERLSCPVALPVPVRGTQPEVEFFGLIILSEPLNSPADCGENVTVNVKLCPGVSDRGKGRP
jgi:hypothetical protein